MNEKKEEVNELYYDRYKIEDLLKLMEELENACKENDIDKKADIVEEIELLYGIPTFEPDILFETPAIHIDEECKTSLYLPIKIPY